MLPLPFDRVPQLSAATELWSSRVVLPCSSTAQTANCLHLVNGSPQLILNLFKRRVPQLSVNTELWDPANGGLTLTDAKNARSPAGFHSSAASTPSCGTLRMGASR